MGKLQKCTGAARLYIPHKVDRPIGNGEPTPIPVDTKSPLSRILNVDAVGGVSLSKVNAF